MEISETTIFPTVGEVWKEKGGERRVEVITRAYHPLAKSVRDTMPGCIAEQLIIYSDEGVGISTQPNAVSIYEFMDKFERVTAWEERDTPFDPMQQYNHQKHKFQPSRRQPMTTSALLSEKHLGDNETPPWDIE